jgi:methionyl-tRNA formyltransferase
MRMVRKLDAGAVYEQVTTPLSDRDTTPLLEERLADLAASTVCDTLSRIHEGRLTAREQDHTLATYAGKLQKDDGWIDWQEDAATIDRQVRAYQPWPGARTQVDTPRGVRRVTLTDVAVVPRQREDAYPGTVTKADKHDLVIACGRGSLQVRRLIPEGSREMTGPEYLRGTPLQEGSVLRHETVNC